MICPKCGRTIPDGSQCPCGAPVLSSNPAVNLIKTLGSSPKFLTAVILYTVAVAFSLLSYVNFNGILNALYYYGANNGLNPDIFYPLMGALESSSLVAMIASAIPTILIVVGMWLFYATCRSTKSGNISTVGLTICKVISYINLVLYCLLAVLLLVVFFVLLLGNFAFLFSNDYGDGSAAVLMIVFGFSLVVLGLIMALVIAYVISVIRMINRLKACAASGAPDNRVSHFLTGFMMFLGVIDALSGVITLFTNPVSGISALASAACLILLSLLLSELRGKMTMLLYPPVAPMYSNMPPYHTVPPQQPGGNDPQ